MNEELSDNNEKSSPRDSKIENDMRKISNSSNQTSSRLQSPTERKISFALKPEYVEPPESKFIKSMTPAELTEHYRTECMKMKVKPIEKVLNFISECDKIPQIAHMLDLSNIKLECDIIESLEIIFMNLAIENLLIRSAIDDSACRVLMEILLHYDCVQHLDLSENSRIGIDGWNAINYYVSKSFCLESVDFSKIIFDDQTITIMSSAVASAYSLKVLILDSCSLNSTRLRVFTSCIIKNSLIEELYLSANRIGPKDCEQIGAIVKNCSSLRIIDLEKNPIGDDGLRMICSFLITFHVDHLESLHLWNTGITCASMPDLASYISLDNSSEKINLKLLNIGKNKILDDGIMSLKSALVVNSSLKKLGLASCKLSASGIIAVAEIIAANRSLVRVDLRDNHVNVAGILALSQALRHNNSMTRINLNTDFQINEFTEIELNRVLDEIKDKCNKNLENNLLSGGSDQISRISTISSEYISFPAQDNPTSSKQAKSLMFSPWKYTKSRIRNAFYKQDIELNASITDKSPYIQEEPSLANINSPNSASNLDIYSLGQIESETSPSLMDLKSETDIEPPTGSRFTVKPVSSPKGHRRCFSESLTPHSPTESLQNTPKPGVSAFIKVTNQSHNAPAINLIPCEEDVSQKAATLNSKIPAYQKSYPPYKNRSRRASLNDNFKTNNV